MLLDDLLEKDKFNKIDILKNNVQGAEHLLLEGATETLKLTNLSWIEVSFKPIYENSFVFTDIQKLLDKSGLILSEIFPGYPFIKGEILQADALFTKLS